VITGTPKKKVTSITVKDPEESTEDFTVKQGESLKLTATTSPSGASNKVLWAVQISSREKGTIDMDSGEFTADDNETGTATIVVKTYDDSNLSWKNVTIEVTSSDP